jgi:uncharacterized protein YcbX
MLGEELDVAEVTEWGLRGDRVYALVDQADGKVATAKNPRKWPHLFEFRAGCIDPAQPGAPIFMTLPDGTRVTSDQTDCSQILSQALAREVKLQAVSRPGEAATDTSAISGVTAKGEEYWPDIEGRDHRNTVTDFALPEGTFFDSATVHLLTTATLNCLHEAYPQGRFEVRRFRPNIVVDLAGDENQFAENAWVGHTLAIGDQVRLTITGPCGRCVMTTLAQEDLPSDSGILRTAVQRNQGHVGVYARVERGGVIRPGDRVKLLA